MPSAPLPPLSAASVLTEWSVDPVALLLTVSAAGAYAAGVRRLQHRGRTWPPGRSVAFGGGIVVLVLATQSGIAAYDTALFSMHVVQHVLIGIVAPLLLALGAPVTLALQASHRGTQVNLLRVLHSRAARVIGHPVVALLVFGFTLFVLYFSPLYELSLDNRVVHAWVHVHFLVAGCLFAWATIGIDPVPHRVAHGARLLLVLFTVPFHAFIGLALLSTATPLAADHYTSLHLAWASAPLDDQHLGAAIMWLVGDLVGLVVGGIVAYQWLKAEERSTRRLDRMLDGQEGRSTAGVGPTMPAIPASDRSAGGSPAT